MLIISYPVGIILLSHDFIVISYHTRRHNIIILCITIHNTIIIHNNCDPAIGPLVLRRSFEISLSLSALYHFELASLEVGALRLFELCPVPRISGLHPSPTIFVVGRLSTRLVATAFYATKRSNTLIYSYIITSPPQLQHALVLRRIELPIQQF